MNLSQRILVAMTGLVLTAVALHTFLTYLNTQKILLPLGLDRQRFLALELASRIRAEVKEVRADVLVVRRLAPLHKFIAPTLRGKSPPRALRARILRACLAHLQTLPHYLQLRIIGRGKNGRELLRVERQRTGGPVRIVPERQLQSKGHRRYFQDTLKLHKGQTYISPIELNQERGKLSTPYQPVLRAATPVHGPDGAVGIVELNIDMQHVLNMVRPNEGSGEKNYLVDAKGQYLVHPQRSFEFAVERSVSNKRLHDEFPSFVPLLKTTTPVVREHRSAQSLWFAMAAVPISLAQGSRVTLLSMTTSPHQAMNAEAIRNSLWTAFVVALLAIVVAFGVTQTITRPLKKVVEALKTFPDIGSLPTERHDEVGLLARTAQRMHAEVQAHTEALQQERQKFQAVVEGAQQGFLIVDQEGVILLANPSTDFMFGYEHGALEGTALDQLLPTFVRPSHKKHMRSFWNKSERRPIQARVELYGLRKDGSEIPLKIDLSPIQTAEGCVALASIVDITEMKKRDAALHQSNQDLEQFAYVASHDLQEPLRMVANYTELLASRYQDKLDERANKYIHYAVDGARRMQQLVSDLLAYSRVGRNGQPFQAVNLNELLESVRQSLQRLIEETDTTMEATDLPTIQADKGQLHQLFQNLLNNAIKFRSERSPHIVVSAQTIPQGFHFTVQDNGIGMETKHAKRIFEMFQRLHGRKEYQGSGIGLAIAKRIVERHGGTIWVESQPGKGTTFHFTLKKSKES